MRIKKYISEIFTHIKYLEPGQKKNVALIAAVLFFTLFSYPIVRSVTDAFFLDSFGARKSPHVWMFSIIALSIVIFLYNKLQLKLRIHRLFLYTSIFTFLFMMCCLFMLSQGYKIWAYPLFVWKEVYIVLLIHMAFGFLNTVVSFETAKILYGPVGSVNGIAGLTGGIFTSQLTYYMGMEWILLIGCISILMAAVMFWLTDHNLSLVDREKSVDKKESPLKSIADVKKYVIYILLIVALSQFCINLANFKFNILFDAIVGDKLLKTRYLAMIYSCVNGLSLFCYIFVVPISFKIFKNKTIHMFIPCFYFITTLIGFYLGGSILLPVAATFIIFKGLDYSLFNVTKEMLYFPLNNFQKYGAKYIVDMVGYRFAKGLISFLLIFLQSNSVINFLLGFFLVLWFITLIPLFRAQKLILKK